MGLASVLCHAKRVTDEMFFVASEALAEYVPDADLQQGKLYPPLKDIRKVSKHLMKASKYSAVTAGGTHQLLFVCSLLS